MTRIVAGVAKGRRIAVPPGESTRPTSERAREGLFSALTAALGSFAGVRVLDLYAGSGAVGLEALSRGAAHSLLVESDRRTAALVQRNADALGLDGAEVRIADVATLAGSHRHGDAYDLAFLDPPYATPDASVGAVLAGLASNGWLADRALVVVERATRGGPFPWTEGFEASRERRYGEATLWYGRAAS